MKIKKIFAQLTALLLLGSTVACTAPATEPATETDTAGKETSTTENATEPATEKPEENGQDIEMEEILNLKHTLRFAEDGTFKVLVFSDVHAVEDLSADTVRAIETLVKRENPNLVIFNGDINWGPDDPEIVRTVVTKMTAYLEEHHIPWAHTYGNHDSEKGGVPSAVTRADQQKIYESFAWCVSKAGDESVPGVGNYVLPILRSDSDTVAFNVWAMDSGDYMNLMKPGLQAGAVDSIKNYTYTGQEYAFLTFEQISWYIRTSEAIETYNGAKVPGLMAFHIPLCEYNTVVKNPTATHMVGSVSEPVCCSEINSGMFAAALMRGDIKMFTSGHDHTNDFMGEYCGIKLAYDASIGYQSYHDMNKLGGRVIEINQDDPWNFTTRMAYLKDTVPEDPDEGEALKTPSIGTAPFRGDLLNAEGIENWKSSSVNLLNGHSFAAVNGQYDTSGLLAAGAGQMTVGVAAGKGFAGSSAYAITKNSQKANAEVTFYLPQTVTLGESKYLRVWVDFTGVDFRKASFGLVTDKGELYCTDENDESYQALKFYYLPEGSDTWQSFRHGFDDGCFGVAQDTPVKNFKGWLAFPVADFSGWEGAKGEYTANVGKSPKATDRVAGVYFYYDLAETGMLNQPFYLDQCALVSDYSVFEPQA